MIPSSLIIPYDVIALIIDEISSEGDYQTLRSFSQTCKEFLPHCRRKLFKSIDLNRKESRKVFALSDVLLRKGNEAVASYVKDFEYDTDPAHADDSRIISMIKRLSNVQQLKLRFCSMRNPYPYWDGIPDILKDALRGLLSLDWLKTLVLHRIDDIPVTELWRARNLSVLELVDPDIEFIQHWESDSTGLHGPPRLQRLVVDDSARRDIIKCLLGPRGITNDLGVSLEAVDFSCLKDLSITVFAPEEWDAAEEITKIGMKTLQHVEYTICQAMAPEGLGEIFSSTDDGMLNLKSLKFVICCGNMSEDVMSDDEYELEPFLSGLCEELSILERASNKHALESIKIEIDITRDSGDFLSIDPNDWRELGNIFLRPGFQKTCLTLEFVNETLSGLYKEVDKEDLQRVKEVEKVLEELTEKEGLSFNYSYLNIRLDS